jgi:chloride channel protein, CIC family
MSSRAKLRTFIGNFFWAAMLGLASGLACVAVRLLFRSLQWGITGHTGLLPQSAESLSPWFRVVIPAAGALGAMLVLWVARQFQMSEMFEGYVEAVRLHGGRIAFLPTFVKTLSSAFSVASGATIGREGSMIQFATATTSWLGRRFSGFRMPLTTQVACGVAAAVAAVYQAPIAAVFFAMEIVLGKIAIRTASLLLIASLAGNVIGAWLLGHGPLFRVPEHLDVRFRADHSWWLVLLLPVLMGLLGPLYFRLLQSLRPMSKWPLALVWSGLLVGLLSLKSSLVWGNGDAALLEITQSFPSISALAAALCLRLLATAFCVGTGTVGGVFTPTIFTGGAVGYLAALLLHFSHPVIFAIFSMAALLAAVTGAPFMAAFMAVELTGEWSFLPLVLGSAFIAVLMARRLSSHSLYAIATPEPANHNTERPQPTPGRWFPTETAIEVESVQK